MKKNNVTVWTWQRRAWIPLSFQLSTVHLTTEKYKFSKSLWDKKDHEDWKKKHIKWKHTFLFINVSAWSIGYHHREFDTYITIHQEVFFCQHFGLPSSGWYLRKIKFFCMKNSTAFSKNHIISPSVFSNLRWPNPNHFHPDSLPINNLRWIKTSLLTTFSRKTHLNSVSLFLPPQGILVTVLSS